MGKPPRPRGWCPLVSHELALRLAILLGVCGVQGSCTPQAPPAPSQITLERVRGMVSVVRQGQSLAVHVPMPLAIGDVVETAAETTALVRYPEAHEVHPFMGNSCTVSGADARHVLAIHP